MGIDYKVVVKARLCLDTSSLPPVRHNTMLLYVFVQQHGGQESITSGNWHGFSFYVFNIKILRLDWGGTCSTKCCLLWLVQLLQLATTYNYWRYLSSTFKRPVFHPSLSINVRYRMESIQRAIDTNPQSKVPKRAFPYQLVVIIQLVANESWFGSKTILGNC